MPSRHAIKTYVVGGWYHIYNRGVEKRLIFLDQEDYLVMRAMLNRAVSQTTSIGKPIVRVRIAQVCLMSNHFHLLVEQTQDRGLEPFMRSAMNAYVRYFNTKYQRVGPLFQGPYKAVLVTSDDDLQAIREYIRQNPVVAGLAKEPSHYPFLWEQEQETPGAGVSC